MFFQFNFVLSILLVISIIGYMSITRKYLLLSWKFIPIFVFSSIACIVYFGGLINLLFEISVAIMVIGLFISIILFSSWYRRSGLITIYFYFFHLFFVLISFIFMLLLAKSYLIHYDNFSHWAIVIKVMLSTNAFPTPDAALIDFKNYPLGVSSFLYYISLFVGKSEPILIIAQGILIFSSFYAMFGVISETKRYLLYAFLVAGLSTISFFNLTIRINNLLVDFLLPIFTLVIFVIVYALRHHPKKTSITILPIVGLLMIVKSTGVIFASIGLMYFVYVGLTKWRIALWKRIIILLGVILGSFIPYIGWSIRMNTLFKGVENKFDVSTSTIQHAEGEKSIEQMWDISSLFLQSSVDLTTRPAAGILIFGLLATVTSIFVIVVVKKKWNLWKVFIALIVVLLLYYAGILAMYLFSMPLDEAIILAGFERYVSSIVILFVGSLVLCTTVDIERTFHYKIGEVPSYRAFKSVRNKRYYQQAIWILSVFSIILLLSEYNGMKSIVQDYENTLPYKVRSITGDRWYENGEIDENKYLFYASDKEMQVTNYYMQYIGRYYLYAPNVDGIVLFYEDNMNNLLSEYDYLVIVESDASAKRLLKKHYDVDVVEGIYEINISGDQIELTLL